MKLGIVVLSFERGSLWPKLRDSRVVDWADVRVARRVSAVVVRILGRLIRIVVVE